MVYLLLGGVIIIQKELSTKKWRNFFYPEELSNKNVFQNNTTLYQINDATPLYIKQMMQQISNHKGISQFFNPTSYQRNNAVSLLLLDHSG